MTRRTDPKWKLPLMSSRRATPRASFSASSKSIEMLPSTMLKDGEDTSEPPETAVKHSSASGTAANSPHHPHKKHSGTARETTMRIWTGSHPVPLPTAKTAWH
ncbi:hypothetical protein BKA61DRAFT_574287 [Leptodontidium sp. MPI-SDFR-AT-0119]|nr:hypothetical protein BKA61DRAFT_574287 [Leptodontidium sp. MPI-SDFR-AT-0119]